MQSNIKDFVRNYFVRSPKTTSFSQLLNVLRQTEGFQTMHSREIQHREEVLQYATEKKGVWAEDADAAPQ